MVELMDALEKAEESGYCVGGGNELNLACDLTIASSAAKFGQAGTRLGSVPMIGGTQILPLLIGDKRAREVIFFSRMYTAEEAGRMGWVNKVVPLLCRKGADHNALGHARIPGGHGGIFRQKEP